MKRDDLIKVLAKPLPPEPDRLGTIDPDTGEDLYFDPWSEVIKGIFGHYASETDDLMIGALKAVRDRTTFEFIMQQGFAGEFALYVLAGHGLTEYGTSPRGAWPDPSIADLWDQLIEKWEAYSVLVWGENESLQTPTGSL